MTHTGQSIGDLTAHYQHIRESAGITLADISRRSKIPIHILEAIEIGAFDRIPSGIYIRSYIRTYATEAGLDPDEVLAAADPFLDRDESLEEIRALLQLGAQEQSQGTDQADEKQLGTMATDDRWVGRALVSATALVFTIAALTAWDSYTARRTVSDEPQRAPAIVETIPEANLAPRPAAMMLTRQTVAQEPLPTGEASGFPPAVEAVQVATSGVSTPGDILLAAPPPPPPPAPKRLVRVVRSQPSEEKSGNIFKKLGRGMKKVFTGGKGDKPSTLSRR